MNRNLALVLAATLGGIGYIAGGNWSANAGAPPVVKLVNAQFIRGAHDVLQADGGVERQEAWYVRACGYALSADGGRLSEPCWEESVPLDAFAPIERLLLDGDAGL